MTEREWLACTEPDDLLEFLRELASDRQFRLFVCACCRRFLPLMPKKPRYDVRLCEKAIDHGERFADGLMTGEALAAAFDEQEWANVSHEGYLAAYAARMATYVKIAGDPWPMLRGRNLIAHPASCGSEYARTVVSRLAAASQTAKGSTPAAKKRVATLAEKRYQVQILRDIVGNPFRPLPPRKGKFAWLANWGRWLDWNDGCVLKLARSIYDQRQFDRLPILADALEEAGCTEAEPIAHCRDSAPHVRGCWVLDLILG